MNKKKLAPLRTKNDVIYALQLKLHERMNKKQISICLILIALKRRNTENSGQIATVKFTFKNLKFVQITTSHSNLKVLKKLCFFVRFSAPFTTPM